MTPFHFKPFQNKDLARAALVDGLILAWQPGLGKSLGALAWALLKCGRPQSLLPAEPVLVIAPEDLHGQWRAELRERFGGTFAALDSIETFRRARGPDGALPPGWYLCSYTQLAHQGTRGGAQPLAFYVARSFGCVIVDEGVRMKSTHSKMGVGLRLLNPRCRLVLTGTPVKNLVSDLFWLAWWAAGGREEAHARFPYPGTAEGHREFSMQFMMAVRQAGSRRVKLSPSLSSVHYMWKLCAPLLLRRLKSAIGEQIPARRRQVIRVPMGRVQQQVYQYHLMAGYRDRHGREAVGARLQALRLAASAPHSELLENKTYGQTKEKSQAEVLQW